LTKKIVACVGGGQLAQMLGQAGEKLGIVVRSSGAKDSCAFSDCEPFTNDLNQEDNFKSFIEDIDVFTFESEHEGLDWAEKMQDNSINVFPPANFVKIAGDRFLEKSHLKDLEIPTAPFELIDASISSAELQNLLEEIISSKSLSPHGIVVKTRHGGYDGKGQWVLKVGEETNFKKIASEIYPAISSPGCIVEGLVDFALECSVIAARSTTGEFASWPLSHNEHRDSILRFSYSPILEINNLEELEIQAKNIARALCEQNDYVGTIAVECFVTNNGLVVNEIAPRVHNSGHWTIEGSITSQFEQHLRAITGMKLGSTQCPGFSAMINLVGVDVDKESFENKEGIYLHWYGKEVRDNRKVGHITIVGSTVEELGERTKTAMNLAEL
jgi:5-(carboxyamino)imidazole ribonucleotide synthase